MEDILVGEIERLKAEVRRWKGYYVDMRASADYWHEQCEKSRAEAKRVRACAVEYFDKYGEMKSQRDEAREWARRLYRALVEIRGLIDDRAYIYGYEVEAIMNIVHKAVGPSER